MRLRKSKSGLDSDQVIDIGILFFGIIIIGVVMSFSATLDIAGIDYNIGYQKRSNIADESLLVFLNEKVENINTQGNEEILIGKTFNSSKSDFNLPIENIKYESLSLDISFVNRSDIYCVIGGYDDICDNLAQYSIIPEKGGGDGFRFEHKVIYVGSQENFTGDILFLKNWLDISNDKTLILTHDSYDVFNKIVGQKVLVKDRFFNIREPLMVDFNQVAKSNIGVFGNYEVNHVYDNLRIDTEVWSKSSDGMFSSVGQYSGINNEYLDSEKGISDIDFTDINKVGAIGYVFNLGSGSRIIVLNLHLKDNLEMLNSESVQMMFGKSSLINMNNKATDLKIDFMKTGFSEIEIKGDLTSGRNIEISTYVNDYLKTCNTYKCEFPMSIELGNGEVNIARMKYTKGEKSFVKGKYITVYDKLIEYDSKLMKSEICTLFKPYLEDVDTEFSKFRIEFVYIRTQEGNDNVTVYQNCINPGYDFLEGRLNADVKREILFPTEKKGEYLKLVLHKTRDSLAKTK